MTEFSAPRVERPGFDAALVSEDKVFPDKHRNRMSQTTVAAYVPRPRVAEPAPNTFAQGMRAGTKDSGTDYSMVKLPERPMMPRLFDERSAFQGANDYGTRTARRTTHLITSWRLERKIRSERSDGEPIVYYFDPATPTKWGP